MALHLGVLGATGLVGHTILQLLEERLFPYKSVTALASQKMRMKEVSLGDDKTVPVHNAKDFDFSTLDLLFSAVPENVARDLVPQALDAGVRVIDKSTAFRMDSNVPLVVPEVNGALLKGATGLVSNPNCVVIPLVCVLSVLRECAPIKCVSVATYQSVSGAGRRAMDQLCAQTNRTLTGQEEEPSARPLAFNVVPQIGSVLESGQTEEEDKIIQETQKILGPLSLAVTCVRVPVFISHGLAVQVQFSEAFSLEMIQKKLATTEGIWFFNHSDAQPLLSPRECVGAEAVMVSRLRRDALGLSLWIMCDNLYKGAALNALQIAEHWLELT